MPDPPSASRQHDADDADEHQQRLIMEYSASIRNLRRVTEWLQGIRQKYKFADSDENHSLVEGAIKMGIQGHLDHITSALKECERDGGLFLTASLPQTTHVDHDEMSQAQLILVLECKSAIQNLKFAKDWLRRIRGKCFTIDGATPRTGADLGEDLDSRFIQGAFETQGGEFEESESVEQCISALQDLKLAKEWLHTIRAKYGLANSQAF